MPILKFAKSTKKSIYVFIYITHKPQFPSEFIYSHNVGIFIYPYLCTKVKLMTMYVCVQRGFPSFSVGCCFHLTVTHTHIALKSACSAVVVVLQMGKQQLWKHFFQVVSKEIPTVSRSSPCSKYVRIDGWIWMDG